MQTVRWWLVIMTVAGGFAFAAISTAQDEAIETEAAEASEIAAEEDAVDATPQDRQDNFIPTEKINVDSEISFPVDI